MPVEAYNKNMSRLKVNTWYSKVNIYYVFLLKLSIKCGIFTSGCYHFPNQRLTPFVCRSNVPVNTAVRGFGVPQGHFIAETIIEHVADYLKMPCEKV